MSEITLQKAILDTLALIPGTSWMRNSNGMLKSRGNGRPYRFGLGEGSADLIGCVNGRFVALEVKLPKGKLSNEQLRWARTITLAGGHYACVRSVQDALGQVAEVRGSIGTAYHPAMQGKGAA